MTCNEIRSYLDKYGDRFFSEALKKVKINGIARACAPIYDGIAIEFNIDKEVAVEVINNYFRETRGNTLPRLLSLGIQGRSSLDMMDEKGILTSDEEEMERLRKGEPVRGYGAGPGAHGRVRTTRGGLVNGSGLGSGSGCS